MVNLDKINFNVSGFSSKQIQLLNPEKNWGGINELQSYIEEIKSISYADYGDFDILRLQEYATALSDVEAKQAALLLSTQGITNSQIQQTLAVQELSTAEQYKAMVEAGLLKSQTSLTNAELQNIIATQLGNTEDAKALMSHLGLCVAIEGEEAQTVQLTAKKMQLLAATGLLTEAQAQQIAMITHKHCIIKTLSKLY